MLILVFGRRQFVMVCDLFWCFILDATGTKYPKNELKWDKILPYEAGKARAEFCLICISFNFWAMEFQEEMLHSITYVIWLVKEYRLHMYVHRPGTLCKFWIRILPETFQTFWMAVIYKLFKLFQYLFYWYYKEQSCNSTEFSL